MSVSFTGSVLSSLFFEHSNCESDQDGFLLGKVVSHVTDTISDTQINSRKEETVTYVHSYVPSDELFTWYDNGGRIVQDRLAELLLDGKHKEVVGWYKSRRHSNMLLSLRERAIHHHLLQCFPGMTPKNFLFLLCTPQLSANLSTHSFDHTVKSFNGRSFQSVPVSVVNLGDTAQSEYKLRPSNTANPAHSSFSRAVNSYSPEFLDDSGNLHSVTSIHTLNVQLQMKLQDLCHKVVESEDRVGSLSAQCKILEDQVLPQLKLPEPAQPASGTVGTLPRTTGTVPAAVGVARITHSPPARPPKGAGLVQQPRASAKQELPDPSLAAVDDLILLGEGSGDSSDDQVGKYGMFKRERTISRTRHKKHHRAPEPQPQVQPKALVSNQDLLKSAGINLSNSASQYCDTNPFRLEASAAENKNPFVNANSNCNRGNADLVTGGLLDQSTNDPVLLSNRGEKAKSTAQSRLRESKKQEPFDFIADLLVKAKAPSSQISPPMATSKSLDNDDILDSESKGSKGSQGAKFERSNSLQANKTVNNDVNQKSGSHGNHPSHSNNVSRQLYDTDVVNVSDSSLDGMEDGHRVMECTQSGSPTF